MEIAKLDSMLQSQQSQVIKNKSQVITKVNDYKVLFFIMLIPALILGWKAGRKEWFGHATKQIVTMGALAVAANFKKQLVSVFSK